MSEATEALRKLARTNPVLASPTRLAIMLLLAIKRKMYFSELQRALDLTPGNLGSHLKKLEEVGYVRMKKVLTRIRPLTLIIMEPDGEIALYEHMELLRSILRGLRRADEEGPRSSGPTHHERSAHPATA